MFDTNVSSFEKQQLRVQKTLYKVSTHFFVLDSRMASSLFGGSLRFFVSDEPFEDDMAL